ncbi:hypothetical protein SAMN05421663_109143 [Terribacillus halophilus]|uniref:Uncharacterized protein n=1 Tax=Terribacillus halophilus TaxID=361279 RepID=A0A1G6U268_9BACI|nr:hypothetical protein [Terribacillus halophilus]SDD35480.1 hypothetical protein SAMN05421663_109143 [Terribacillus halophilus]
MPKQKNRSKRIYSLLIWKNLLFDSIYTILLLLFYWLAWRLIDTITYIGQLRTNLPLLALCAIVILSLLCRVFWIYRKQRFLLESDRSIVLTNENLCIGEKKFPLANLQYIRTYRKGFIFRFKNNILIPVEGNQDISFLKGKAKIPGLWLLALAVFLLITVMGAYKVYYNATDFHGALSWRLERMASEERAKLGSDNFYEVGIEGIIGAVDDKVGLEPYLMTDSLEIEFDEDGTMTSIYAFINGYDENKVHRHNYLIYNNDGGDNVIVDKQEWNDDRYPYVPENDLKYVLDMMQSIPVQEVVEQKGEKHNAIMYKGVRDWAFPENLQYVTRDGEIYPPDLGSVSGPTISLYVPGKEEEITPYRYVWKE